MEPGEVYYATVEPRKCMTRPTARYTGRLAEWFIHQVDNAPALAELAVLDFDAEIESIGADWRDFGFFGFVIRVYPGIHGNFYHFRCHPKNGWDKEYVDRPLRDRDEDVAAGITSMSLSDALPAEQGWVDVTLYRGERLPLEVLRAVYNANRDVSSFKRGGRDMEMSEEAWKLLDNWRDGLEG